MIDWKEFPSVPPPKRGTYLTWQPGSEKPFMDERYSVLHWTGTRFFSSFPVSHWAELEPPGALESPNARTP